MPPTLSRGAALTWAHRLRMYNFSQRTLLSDRLRGLAASLQTRSLIVVLSDLHDVDTIVALELLAAAHELIVLWLEDPAETQPKDGSASSPMKGFFRAREAETGRNFLFSKRASLTTHRRIRQELRDAGLEFLHLRVDQPVIPPLQHFLRHRKSMGHL